MKRIRLLVAAVTAVCIAAAAAPAHAVEAVPDITKLEYEPIGHFKPGDPLPPANAIQADNATGEFLRQEYADGIFNPSGNFNAYDTNVFEVLAMPYRAAGDEHTDDPLGNGEGGPSQHGRCSEDPRSERPRGGAAGFPAITGECFNHQMEYIEYYERTMMSILGKFGAFTKRYEFYNPSDPTDDQFQPPLLASNTMGGRAINPAVIVPGTTESDESIVIGAHFDKTNDGPAAAWDSQEGHAQMIRVAKLMADYWDALGARPTATVKFIPWDGEESGTLGSEDYANNVIPPGDEEFKVRGYWNTDPCAGGYPAFRFGNRANRTQLGIQLANPFRGDDPVTSTSGLASPNLDPKYHPRIDAFNDGADELVEQVFEHLDDKLETQPPDQPQIFIATSEGTPPLGGDIGTGETPAQTKPVVVGKGRPFLFSSDWRNFEDRGIPFFNPGPEITGPGSFGDPGNPDALVILHSPNDNLDIMNRYAGAPSGQVAEGWVKGMEMCSHLLAWGMLQPSQGGATLEDVGKLTAYYEALPNEAGVDEPVHFDASGSHIQTADGTTTEGLTYAWDFGDGKTGTGRDTYHRYQAEGTYQSKLTVTNTANGQTATMEIPIVVQAVPAVALPIPALTAPDSDEDGTFDLDYSVRDTPSNLSGWEILEAADYRRLLADDMEQPFAESRWAASEPTNPDIAPWQESDSSTRKVRGNARSSGAQSYWTGVPTDKFKPAQAQTGESVLTLKEPLQVPQEAGAEFKYNSLFLSESDDRGFVQIAEADDDLSWETIDIVGGPTDVCSPADSKSLNGELTQRGADLSSWAGKKIIVRFVYAPGPTNPALSQPCGWYVDDIEIAIGTFKPIDRSDQLADVGQFFEGKYTVRNRAKGTYAYRVRGLYPPNGEYGGQASNIEVVEVTTGANPAPP
ncbi:MAG: M28 family peptidase, partial [Actinomycetota bacterium]|nr:M28 family peptidase [Actinomycetota bacterium]